MFDAKEEIKSRLDIVDVVRDYIQLSKAGVNYKARCPFHNEKTPSFVVSPEKQIWHCFGCGEGGDIFTFVMKMDGVDFPEALRILATKAGVEIKRESPQVNEARRKLFEINQKAMALFQETLQKTEEGKKTTEYLIQRGLSRDSIDDFKIGLAPLAWDKLVQKLKGEGFKDNECVEAGVALSRKSGGVYDRFRGRIMFPIFNTHGDVVGFGGREFFKSRPNQDSPKYVNTPTTPIYNKSFILYGLDKAKNFLRRYDFAVLVEGYTDVIMSYQADVKNVVAASGTSLTEGQLDMIKRYTDNIVLAFDMDIAGDIATRRGIEMALSKKMNVKVISMPEGKDPADIIKEDPKKWLQILKAKKSVGDHIIDSVFKGVDTGDVVQKKKAIAEVIKFLSFMADKVEQDHFIRKLAERAGVEEGLIRDQVSLQPSTLNPQPSKTTNDDGRRKAKSEKRITRRQIIEDRVLGIMLAFPELTNKVAESKVKILPRKSLSLYENLKDFYNRTGQFDFEAFREIVASEDKELADRAAELVLIIENEDIEDEKAEGEANRCLGELYIYHLRRWLKEKEGELKMAEARKDEKVVEELQGEVAKLTKLLQKQMAEFR